jgi:serine/threonine protein kinase
MAPCLLTLVVGLLLPQGVLGEYEAATAMRCVMDSLAALHAADVVFGDVKPSNFVRTKVGLPVHQAPCAQSHSDMSGQQGRAPVHVRSSCGCPSILQASARTYGRMWAY